MADERLISADSHVCEPKDLWTTRMAAPFRERAPRVEHRGATGEWFVADGILPYPVALGMAAPKEVDKRSMFGTYEEGRPGGWDPEARIADQDIDGVAAEVLYPTNALMLFALRDGPFQAACFTTYNDWVAEFTRAHPDRLAGIALVSVHDPAAAAREIERTARLGLRGIMVQGDNPEPHYGDPSYDPLWAACQAHSMPVSLHTLTGRKFVDAPKDLGLARYVGLIHMVQLTLATLIMHAVCERFPGLKLVSAENDIGWIAHYLMRLDCLPQAPPLGGTAAARRPAEHLLQAPGVGDLHGRPAGDLHARVLRRGADHVGVGLPAQRLHVAAVAGDRGAEPGRRVGGGAGADRRGERARAVLGGVSCGIRCPHYDTFEDVRRIMCEILYSIHRTVPGRVVTVSQPSSDSAGADLEDPTAMFRVKTAALAAEVAAAPNSTDG